MKGHFVCKPGSKDELFSQIYRDAMNRRKPTEINPIATVRMDLGQYVEFCDAMMQEWDFLRPYAEQSVFRKGNTADCVIIECPGQIGKHTSELQSHSGISYAVFCLKKKSVLSDQIGRAHV